MASRNLRMFVYSHCNWGTPVSLSGKANAHHLDILFDPVFLLKLIGSRLYFCHNFSQVSEGLFTY